MLLDRLGDLGADPVGLKVSSWNVMYVFFVRGVKEAVLLKDRAEESIELVEPRDELDMTEDVSDRADEGL